MRLDFLVGEETVSVDVSRDGEDWALQLDGQAVPLQAVRDTDGAWLVDTHQGRRRLFVAGRGDERWVFCDGRVHLLRLHDPDHAEAAVGGAAGPNLAALMPGKVVQVMVAEGDPVTPGQGVLVMESMKMETELAAAVGGTVGRVHVAAGQLVGQGDPLVDIVPEG